jgi:tRNA threonylcarbamoyladenosine biosynthesis protein TsaE
MKLAWRLPDVQATEQLGQSLATALDLRGSATRVLYLSGELGAGKTTVAAALLQALGVQGSIRSPTYSLLELYELPQGLAVHADFYRLQQIEELEHLGLRDYLGAQTLLLIEWPERAAGALPKPDLSLQLTVGAERSAELEAHSDAGLAWLAGVPAGPEVEN